MPLLEKTDNLFLPVRSYVENNILRTLGCYSSGSFWPRFEIPILNVLVASVIYVVLSTILGEEVSRTIFIVAVIVSSWLDILKSGVLASVLSFAVIAYFSIGFDNIFSLEKIAQIIDLGVFLAVCIFISFLISSLSWARERKQKAYDSVWESRNRLERANRRVISILESINDGFVFFDRDANFVYANKKIEKFFGHDREELKHKNIWKEFPALRDSLFFEKYREALGSGESVRFEYFVPRISRWFMFSFFPAKDGTSLYVTDITARKNQEKKQNELIKKQDEFIAIASHELKTPLTSIKLFAQLLGRKLKGVEDKETQEDVISLEEQVDKLVHLINSLLDASKIRRNKIVLEKKILCLDSLISDLVKNIQKITLTHKIYFENAGRLEVVVDEEKIREVLTNIINNAIKYSPNSDKIEIKLENKDGQALVSVRDYGQGVSKRNQRKIFDRFFQQGEGTLGRRGSLGLGLYISKEMIKAHGGKIWVESEEGKGSTFYFNIPLHQPSFTEQINVKEGKNSYQS